MALGVLNAFRHQRMNDENEPAADPLPETCSTPFGING